MSEQDSAAKEIIESVMKKPPKDDKNPYSLEDLNGLKMSLVVDACFLVWTRYCPSIKTPNKKEEWMLWIGTVIKAVVANTAVQREKYAWVNYKPAVEGKDWKAPTAETPFPIDGLLNSLKMEYTGFIVIGSPAIPMIASSPERRPSQRGKRPLSWKTTTIPITRKHLSLC